MDRYQKVEKGGGGIGEGAYGVVYKGKDKQTGAFVAMKVRSRFDTTYNIETSTSISFLYFFVIPPKIILLSLNRKFASNWKTRACPRRPCARSRS